MIGFPMIFKNCFGSPPLRIRCPTPAANISAMFINVPLYVAEYGFAHFSLQCPRIMDAAKFPMRTYASLYRKQPTYFIICYKYLSGSFNIISVIPCFSNFAKSSFVPVGFSGYRCPFIHALTTYPFSSSKDISISFQNG